MNGIRPHLTTTALLTLLVSSGLLPADEERTNRALSLSLPHDGCRLTIFPNGSANIHYGAAPWTVQVPADTFDFDDVLQNLLPKALDWRAEAHSDIEPGSVLFPGSNRVKFVDDTILVRGLLERGWAARLPPQAPWHDDEEPMRIKRACAFE